MDVDLTWPFWHIWVKGRSGTEPFIELSQAPLKLLHWGQQPVAVKQHKPTTSRLIQDIKPQECFVCYWSEVIFVWIIFSFSCRLSRFIHFSYDNWSVRYVDHCGTYTIMQCLWCVNCSVNTTVPTDSSCGLSSLCTCRCQSNSATW